MTEVDARARTLPDGVTLYVPAEQGHTLRLTIDRDVQAAVERAVRECAQVNDAVSVQAIAMDVNTGAVLAMAMYPTYDPANPPRDDLDKLNELMRLTVLGDVYEPGSTFKMLTASAAIDCGATSPQEGFYCSGKITVDGSTVRCWGAPHGTETMARALENSCNPVFTQLALRLGSERFYQYLHAFGLGRRTGSTYTARRAASSSAEPGEERRSGAHRLRAERRGHAHSDDYGGVRGGQRRAADEAISGGGH
ncbi:MAG: penicillin-binding transpeptidase domain-containing protein [Christensenellales bacterium]